MALRLPSKPNARRQVHAAALRQQELAVARPLEAEVGTAVRRRVVESDVRTRQECDPRRLPLGGAGGAVQRDRNAERGGSELEQRAVEMQAATPEQHRTLV